MRLAVLADIHGNLVALEAVLADLETLGGADKVWVLGDLAADGAQPSACIQRVQGLEHVEIIYGNTDRYLITGERHPRRVEDEEAFKTLAEQRHADNLSLDWTLAQLSWADYDALRKLGGELGLNVAGYGYVIGFHGAPGDDESDAFEPDAPDETGTDALLDREGRLAIGAHTHKQMDRVVGRWRVLNPGSVGIPETPGQACWLMLTFHEGEVTVDLRRVRFDLETVVNTFQAVDHPAPHETVRRLLGKET